MSAVSRHAVLIVDDDPDIREALRQIIEKCGHSVATAGNGAEALDTLRAGVRPSVILLDLMMPVKDGFEFRAEQRQDEALANLPVIVLSAHYNSKQHALALGAVAHFQKPIIDLVGLLSVVDEYCGKHQ